MIKKITPAKSKEVIVKKRFFSLNESTNKIIDGLNYISLDLGFSDSFPDGEWKKEPDYMGWIDATTLYACVCRRNAEAGVWLGYAGVGSEHSLAGYSCSEVNKALLEKFSNSVHGGVTFSEAKLSDYGWLVEPQELASMMRDFSYIGWWIGFDCASFEDLTPLMIDYCDKRRSSGLKIPSFIQNQTYKNANFIRRELTAFCRRLKDFDKPSLKELKNEDED